MARGFNFPRVMTYSFMVFSCYYLMLLYKIMKDEDLLTQKKYLETIDAEASKQLHIKGPIADGRKLMALKETYSGNCTHIRPPSSAEIKIRNEMFQYYYDNTTLHEIYIYSVWFDHRPYVGKLPVLRLLGVSRTLKKSPICYVWYEGIPYPFETEVTFRKNGAGHGVEGVKMEQYFFTCKLTSAHPIPSHVSVVPALCDPPTMYVPVQVPSKKREHEVAVCGPLIWGDSVNSNVYRIVEWIEMLRDLGATEVTIYISTVKGMEVPNATMAALEHYSEEGFVDLRYMPGPRYEASWSNVNAGDPSVLNDCMYRNTHRYKYAVVMDADEIIMPREDITYPQMLKTIDKKQKVKYPWPSYSFRNTYFWLGCDSVEEGSDPLIDKLYAMRIKTREQNNKFLWGTKSIIDPRKCISVFNHYCYIRFPQMEKPFTIDVKPEIAMNNHYRVKHGRDKTKCQDLKKEGIGDSIGDRYRKRVIPKIKKMLRKVGVKWQI